MSAKRRRQRSNRIALLLCAVLILVLLLAVLLSRCSQADTPALKLNTASYSMENLSYDIEKDSHIALNLIYSDADFPDTLATYTTTYYTSMTAKETNLKLACEAINGTILEPGDEFSFNDVVGERTAEKGYQEASAYVAGTATPELGGGVCQVATTIYYCVLCDDLEVLERSPHYYTVSYGENGIDATVYWDDTDFRFKNSSDHAIRIDAETADGNCTVSLMGVDENHYTTELDAELLQTISYNTYERAMEGDDVSGIDGYVYSLTRRIYDADGNLVREDTPEDLGSDIGYSTYAKRDEIIYTG